jgi:hypothetical protein
MFKQNVKIFRIFHIARFGVHNSKNATFYQALDNHRRFPPTQNDTFRQARGYFAKTESLFRLVPQVNFKHKQARKRQILCVLGAF